MQQQIGPSSSLPPPSAPATAMPNTITPGQKRQRNEMTTSSDNEGPAAFFDELLDVDPKQVHIPEKGETVKEIGHLRDDLKLDFTKFGNTRRKDTNSKQITMMENILRRAMAELKQNEEVLEYARVHLVKMEKKLSTAQKAGNVNAFIATQNEIDEVTSMVKDHKVRNEELTKMTKEFKDKIQNYKVSCSESGKGNDRRNEKLAANKNARVKADFEKPKKGRGRKTDFPEHGVPENIRFKVIGPTRESI